MTIKLLFMFSLGKTKNKLRKLCHRISLLCDPRFRCSLLWICYLVRHSYMRFLPSSLASLVLVWPGPSVPLSMFPAQSLFAGSSIVSFSSGHHFPVWQMVLVLDVSNKISPTFVEQLTLSATILNFSSFLGRYPKGINAPGYYFKLVPYYWSLIPVYFTG